MSDAAARHRRLRVLFDAALERDPPTRGRYLDEVCGDDGDLRVDVSRLLAAHAQAHAFLEHPAQFPHAPVTLTTTGASASTAHRQGHEHGHEHAQTLPAVFSGNARFTVLRTLGIGGMGIVYEVHDTVRDEVVALKTLLHTGAADIYRLKREFRTLADVAHVNLVCLYELFIEASRGFFTMELVRGASFVEYVRADPSPAGRETRLLDAFTQLVAGVTALHRAGKLHRDIKPSNIVVTPDGRVVLLDFGLITELQPQRHAEHEIGVAGTPAYMSPEEAAGAPPSQASDWYSVGATLYEAITGDVPISGSPLDVLRRKAQVDPPAPRDIDANVSKALDAACMGLLRRDPLRRLTGGDVLSMLRGRATSTIDVVVPREPPFVGRTRELDLLTAQFTRATQGHTAIVRVSGVSGIGKSALVRAFLAQCTAREGVVVLPGRCYEHESVPYKALDGVIDSVSRYLCALPRDTADALLPRDVAALTRLFPVLLQAPAVADARDDSDVTTSDPIALRRRALDALRELLARLAATQPLIIWIDDLQWSDDDSAIVLDELLRPPGLPGVMIVLTSRGDAATAPAATTAIELEPIADADAAVLVQAFAPGERALDTGITSAIIAEAAGNPFLIEQLARHVVARDRDRSQDRPTYADVLDQQLHTLPAEGRRFLETLAICGRPMTPSIVADAATVTSALRPLLARLRSAHFIRSGRASEQIEAYHDRIRESIASGLSPDAVRDIHIRMAETLTTHRVDDPEALYEHCLGAGHMDRAAVHAAAAAARANEALAFDRAATYYTRALQITSRQDWRIALAVALANAGRPPHAADAFLDAAADADPSQRVEWRRRAAEQFLIGGHIDRGLEVIESVLDDVGMRLAKGPRTAAVSLIARRLQLTWRGLDFVARQADDISPAELLRVDTCWSVMTGLATVDMIRACEISTRHALLALKTGEPYRVARSLAIEGAFTAAGGNEARAGQVLARARALASAIDRPHTIALVALGSGMASVAFGRWREGSTYCEQALAILRDRCTGVTWELNATQNFLLGALLYQGELADVSTRVPPLLADAQVRGNLFVETELCTRMNLFWLAADQPDEGERRAIASIQRWSQQGFHRQHYSAALARIQTELYRGDAEAAWAICEECRPALRRTLLMRVQLVRIEFPFLRARCALAMAASGRGRAGRARPFLAIARHEAARIARENMHWSNPIAALLHAGIANLERDAAASAARLREAIDGFDRAGMQHYAAAARGRLGALLPGEAGEPARLQADRYMTTQRVRNAASMTRMLAPGFPDVP